MKAAGTTSISVALRSITVACLGLVITCCLDLLPLFAFLSKQTILMIVVLLHTLVQRCHGAGGCCL